MVMRKCTGPCDRELEECLDNFYFKKDCNRFCAKCINCKIAEANDFYKNNKEKAKQTTKIYRENNKEKIALDKKNHYESNKEEILVNKKHYYEENREEILQDRKKYQQNNKEKIVITKKKYYEENKEIISENGRNYYQENRESILEKNKEYVSNNKDYVNNYQNKYRKNKRKNDPVYRFMKNVSTLIRLTFKSTSSSKNGESSKDKLPSGSGKDYVKYIESLWQEGMNWKNHGPSSKERKTWQIDHIIPQSLLKYSSYNDLNFKICWDVENLKPLWSEDNTRKADILTEEAKILLQKLTKKYQDK